ncbi:MAG: energy-coupling factor transporter ATPase [Negativicutes bacterium]|nr:energy-coupling factor transporter ATPase [Negativicutes bacterium]
MIEIENLYFSYNSDENSENVWALQGINLIIPAGQFVVVLGSNGSGKSTLAKHLNGMLAPTQGTCLVDNIDTRNQEQIFEIRKKVGMVFQNPDNQIVASIVEEDVAFGPENLGLPSEEIRSRVDWALEQVNMSSYKKQGPYFLSGGQKQRVAIAGVLAMKPQYIVLDESTAMLDPEGREEVIGVINQLRRESNITILLITHHMEEALEADRVIVMDQGKILLDGLPDEIFFQDTCLKQAGLEIPISVQLIRALEKRKIQVATKIKIDELVNELCQLKSKI